uniref:Uncharacterized protein n=1 Tax=Tanacetum cinerariifolium TaxID=118510 RepID=A0A6L2LVQ3_TANCI|nr:hypothetical protein [Tanacetum cinerariifolium]
MSDKVIKNNTNLQDDQVPETLDTVSLADFVLTQDHDQVRKISTSSSAAEDFFEFFRGGLREEKMMSHAEDIIFCGKLVPINEQRKIQLQQSEKHHQQNNKQQHEPVGCRRSRSDSMPHVKRTRKSPLNSRSLNYKNSYRNSSMRSEQGPEIRREGSGNKSSSSRWYVFLFGLVKVPPSEMDLKDIKNRQVRRIPSKALFGSLDSCDDVVKVKQNDDQKKCSWKVLGYLSCKSTANDVVTSRLPYMPKV